MGRNVPHDATASIPVVALTGMVARGAEAKVLRAGCDAYLTKPINVQAFRETLRLALGVGPIGPRGTPRRRQ